MALPLSDMSELLNDMLSVTRLPSDLGEMFVFVQVHRMLSHKNSSISCRHCLVHSGGV